MKSKISFINRTMLQKNVKLYWPIWTLYTIVLLLNGPFSMWSRFKNAEFIYGKNWHKYMLDIISPAISMEADMIFIFVMALVTGMAMFSYLYNSRACNMIHSMPVTRRQLFSTNVLTGLLFMWIPQIIKYFMSFVICISYGNTKVVHIGINLLAAMGISFFISPATTAAPEIAPHVPAIVPRPAPNPCVIFLSVSSSIDASLQKEQATACAQL